MRGEEIKAGSSFPIAVAAIALIATTLAIPESVRAGNGPSDLLGT
jgi:hypothetical protein